MWSLHHSRVTNPPPRQCDTTREPPQVIHAWLCNFEMCDKNSYVCELCSGFEIECNKSPTYCQKKTQIAKIYGNVMNKALVKT